MLQQLGGLDNGFQRVGHVVGAEVSGNELVEEAVICGQFGVTYTQIVAQPLIRTT